ncbi:MAG: DUF5681 domain-containing protein, partial [Pseudolabrys sp.]
MRAITKSATTSHGCGRRGQSATHCGVGPKQRSQIRIGSPRSRGDQHTRGDAMQGPKPAENTAQKQRGRPFEPGKSGNPKGRPKGSRNQATLLA